ncbi:glycyl-tRNA synthetase, putative [Entamoeba invadens IP1]|uniref:glycine--tRNA ligase n=1 Tax=Entamoeba invadens IP1 TaxID=370355 RepID=A0A0A1U7Y8_ENTIV|nr:glycyl-tRNA synthetase, putative [Entamoeba invadens IP1]ELP91013.1 glycyl-tRNA synthetase, putative [Entamoeba invadens IP1]|eukprot:XP_004257784.1 glycyl-tRNA synthetase, putative [Entamoeba invadens IP1]
MQRPAEQYTKEKLLIKKKKLDDVLKQRNIVVQAYEIYGGIAGLYDMGPLGCALKQNILQFWRKHFTTYENLFEVEGPILTPKCVLEASGHTAKFSDYMVKDMKNGCCYRADHILKTFYEKQMEDPKTSEQEKEHLEAQMKVIDNLSKEELGAAIKNNGIKAPDSGNDLSDPVPFNLMFATDIGPVGDLKAFLRPETAQGIFTMFKRNLEYNGGKVPFGVTQIGNVFRNEIAPRNGLLRVREFTLAEIEYFVLPDKKTHKNFADVENLNVQLYPRELQLADKEAELMTLKQAVADNVINSQLLAYFMGRTYKFLTELGIPGEHIRFRQHLKTEMAHYAKDCWDAEIRMSYGWVECVGHADRGDYDLSNHARCSKVDQSVYITFDEPKEVCEVTITFNKGALGKKYRKDSQKLFAYVEKLNETEKEAIMKEFEANGVWKITVENINFELKKEDMKITSGMKKVHGESIIPHVIEPSFGIGRVLTGVLEHCFWLREGDENRSVLSVPAAIAPVKLGIFPLLTKPEFTSKVSEIEGVCQRGFVSFKSNTTAVAIGKKYSQADEAGIPFAITVDHKTLSENTVTLRDRDTMKQVRVPEDKIVELVTALSQFHSILKFEDLLKTYPVEEVKEVKEN